MIKRMLNRFNKNFTGTILLKELDEVSRKKILKDMLKDNIDKIISISICIIFLQLFYITSDIITGFYNVKNSRINLIAEIVLLVSSICALLYGIKNNKKPLGHNRAFIDFYYLALVVGLSLFLAGDVLRGIKGFSASYFYMIVFIISPIAFFLDQIIMYILVLASTLFIMICFNGYIPDLIQYCVVLIILVLISLYIRGNLIKLNISKNNIEKLNEKLQFLSYNDQLTSSLNRHALEKYIDDNKDKWIEDCTKVSLLMFDVDNFKSFNDHFSHINGDGCLKQLSLAVSKHCSSNIPHIFRYGGDEFVIFIINTDENDIIKKALEIKRDIETLKIKRNDNIEQNYVTISIGCAILNINKDNTLNDIISLADEQLYNAKENGKNCVSLKGNIYR